MSNSILRFYLELELILDKSSFLYFCICMNLPSYEFTSDAQHLVFYFESVSDQRTIKKVVHFYEIQKGIYNLFLGDVDSKGQLSDISISDNKDMEKILATVVQTILTFFVYYPNQKVFFEGSTYSRTCLYRIAISNYLKEFNEIFNIYGTLNGIIEPFVSNKNYESFVISLK